ncbi:MAG: M3 family oligoendopeptidase [Verrucomicrobium sp.]|nr:M3 family oligoendopeptidase [Verrucomicrobium sp.]
MKTSPYRRRAFLPEKADLADLMVLDDLYRRLRAGLRAAPDAPALEKWLDDYGELLAALSQERERRYIAHSLQKDDVDLQSAYDHFAEVVAPWCEPRDVELERLLEAHPAFAALPDYYEAYRRSIRADTALFRPANLRRLVEEEHLRNEYDVLYSGLSAPFEGRERTAPEIEAFLENPDRARREKAWRTAQALFAGQAETLHALYSRQVALRHQIAREADFDDYRGYFFAAMGRAYGPEDCLRLHGAVERQVVPLLRRLNEARRRALGVETLRPWDLAADPFSRPPLRPFRTVAELLDKTEASFAALHPQLGAQFRKLRDLELLDLETRAEKAPGGYSADLAEARLPYSFANVGGSHYDVVVLQHEAGHAFHTLACREQRLYDYRANIPLEFCEVASAAMEHLGAAQYGRFYGEADARRAARQLLEDALASLPAIAAVDAFQHWAYAHPDAAPAERDAQWGALCARFNPGVDWSGLESFRDASWHQISHFFDAPLYYIEYAVARLGALQVWSRARREPEAAIDDLLAALELGGSVPLPGLFETAGLRLSFGEEALAPLVAEAAAELDRLADAPAEAAGNPAALSHPCLPQAA